MMKLPADMVSRFRGVLEGKSVCVTGGAGFIGSHLVDALLSVGATIRVIDDLSNASADHTAELMEMEPDRVRLVHGSILEDEALAEAVDGVTAVFHLAAIGSVPRSIEDPERVWTVNATGTLRVLEACRAEGVKRLVFSASSSAYGDAPSLPKAETMRPEPESPYAASKIAAEAMVTAWSRSYGIDGVSLRYFNVFGPRQPADSAYAGVVPAFANAMLAERRPVVYGNGEQTRDFTYVANAVLANLLAACADRRFTGEVANIGTGRRVSINELANMMSERLLARPADIDHRDARSGDVVHSQASIGVARALLGYQPIVSLEEGLDETIEWYRGEGDPTASGTSQGTNG